MKSEFVNFLLDQAIIAALAAALLVVPAIINTYL